MHPVIDPVIAIILLLFFFWLLARVQKHINKTL
jgi:hypothetical protein